MSDGTSAFAATDTDRANPFATPQAALHDPVRMVTTVPVEALNPWWSMWIYPRVTTRQILDRGSTRMVPVLAVICGISATLDRASMRGMPANMPAWGVLVMALILGPLVGLVTVYVGGVILGWIGRRLGGVGTSQEVRTALAWSYVLDVEMLVLWIPSVALFGGEIFHASTPAFDAWAEAQPWVVWPLLILLGIVSLVSIVWSLVVRLKCIAEAHQFSAWRALASVFVILLPFLFLIFIAVVAAVLGAIQQQGI